MRPPAHDAVEDTAVEVPPAVAYPVLAVGGVLGAMVVAFLVASGNWHLAAGLLLALPVVVVLHRWPLSAIVIWMVVQPYLVDLTGGGGMLRKVFWLVHRAMPPAAVLIIVVGAVLLTRDRKLPRLGWPEALMAGYLVMTVVSIVYSSPNVTPTLYLAYDRIFIPMCLYLIVRLAEPDEDDLRWFIPVVVFLVVSQAFYGLLSWFAPGSLPDAWLGRAGSRTTGSLRSPSVFTTTMFFGGLFLLVAALNVRRSSAARLGLLASVAAAAYMVFLSFNRASWLAAALVLVALLFLYPKFIGRVVLIVTPIVLVILIAGIAGNQIQTAEQRFAGEAANESALSRLPVVLASWRMFEDRPLTGFGYGNFDLYDREYQEQVGDLVVPEKDHASHNLYLTILAEQGIVALLLFLGPAVVWLSRTGRARRRLPGTGLWSRQLLVVLWLALLTHVVVNNFSNMRVTFGLGMWWITLGLIASMIASSTRAAPEDGAGSRAVASGRGA